MAGADKRLADALREDALATDFTDGHWMTGYPCQSGASCCSALKTV